MNLLRELWIRYKWWLAARALRHMAEAMGRAVVALDNEAEAVRRVAESLPARSGLPWRSDR